MDTAFDTSVEDIAMVCHEVNRAYCNAIGDTSQRPWDEAPEWQKTSAVKGVQFALDNPDAPPSASHDSWLAEKEATGWKYGPVKDPEKKEHPAFLPYAELPQEQKIKDHLFKAVVAALR
jgi:RyR domain-containing protein